MEYKNKSASLTPGFTFPRKGENDLDDVRSADQRVSACVGSYDLDDRYSMVKKLEKKHPEWNYKGLTTFYGGKKDNTKLVDNGVPGPDTYNPDPRYPVPSFLIKDRQNKSKTGGDLANVGPA